MWRRGNVDVNWYAAEGYRSSCTAPVVDVGQRSKSRLVGLYAWGLSLVGTKERSGLEALPKCKGVFYEVPKRNWKQKRRVCRTCKERESSYVWISMLLVRSGWLLVAR